MEDLLPGYSGKARKLLEEKKTYVWSRVKLRIDGLELNAIILPAPAGSEELIYVKLDNGYNTAFNVNRIRDIKVLSHGHVEYKIKKREIRWKSGLPHVVIIGAGGTIASRVEYETGAVKPAFTPTELLNANPELANIARIEPIELFNILSEHMTPRHWIQIVKKVEEIANSGVAGIVITHGTDTMHFTAAAISFMLVKLAIPVVLTGAQRSSDRPSSDASFNLICSTRFAAYSDCAEVVICMHAFPDDIACFAHRGVRVRKMHSSRRDTFQTVGDLPIAIVMPDKIKYLKDDYKRREKETVADAVFEEKTALIYMYPGISSDIIETLIDKRYRGLVLAGTGLGHAPEYLFSTIKRAIGEGMHIVMTSQCPWPHIQMNVYETGRKLLQIGVIPGENMLPEVAYVKLGWILAHTDDRKEVTRLIQTNLRGEIIERESVLGYPFMLLKDTLKGYLE